MNQRSHQYLSTPAELSRDRMFLKKCRALSSINKYLVATDCHKSSHDSTFSWVISHKENEFKQMLALKSKFRVNLYIKWWHCARTLTYYRQSLAICALRPSAGAIGANRLRAEQRLCGICGCSMENRREESSVDGKSVTDSRLLPLGDDFQRNSLRFRWEKFTKTI